MSRTILVVDDDPSIRALITTTLEDIADFELVEAPNGQQAIETASQLSPEIVFLDLEMGPGLDGVETCRRLRSQPSTADCRIVMLTGYNDDEIEDRARSAGVDLFLTKPFSPLGLLRLVDELA
ncbi:MAG TPA: response regulator [Thermoleophilaceae bacterium]|nr:response regulator [Thermoleophilaceae bacterium]